MPFDAPRSGPPFENEDERRAWIEAMTRWLLANPTFKAMVVTALAAMVESAAEQEPRP
jgi:hypothetical protein